ncbi:MAG: hypothetical protein OEL20_08945 [Sulfuritalea sp.]|nr:hypothetical protein [Sulfuritalea sp.]
MMTTFRSPAMNAALSAKQQRRRELAALPYADKIRILLRLQRMADAIRQTRGAAPRAWPIDEEAL